MSKRMALAASALLALACTCASVAAPDDQPWTDAPFVIGAPGRLDAEGDRRQPRRYLRDDSAVAAYADVEEVEDPIWLQHEIEAYARRAFDCAGNASPWCRREVRRIDGARIVALSAGVRAEVVWLSDASRAVRLGWRRIVVTPTGSMTIDSPPREFAAAMLAEFPSRLPAVDLDDSDAWARVEIDRLLYYAHQVVAGLNTVEGEAYRRHALRFVEENLARVAQLRVRYEMVGDGGSIRLGFDGRALPSAALPFELAEELAALRAWRSGAPAPRLCAAPSIGLSPAWLMSPLDASP
jgi:hypothetical protein